VLKGNWGDIISTAVALAFMAPFLWALTMYHPHKEALGRIWANRNYRSLVIVLEFARIGIAILFIGLLLNQFFSVQVGLIVGLVIIALLAASSKKIQKYYIRIENRFMHNLNAREISQAGMMHHALIPWDAHLTSFEVAPESAVVGRSLMELHIREDYGVNVAVIERGERTLTAPSRDERIFPGDKLYVFGTDEQMETFRQFIQAEQRATTASGGAEKEEVRLQKLLVTAASPLLHKTIRQAGVREKTRGLIVGIEKKGERILNPNSELMFEEGDIVWIVGSPRRVKQL